MLTKDFNISYVDLMKFSDDFGPEKIGCTYHMKKDSVPELISAYSTWNIYNPISLFDNSTHTYYNINALSFSVSKYDMKTFKPEITDKSIDWVLFMSKKFGDKYTRYGELALTKLRIDAISRIEELRKKGCFKDEKEFQEEAETKVLLKRLDEIKSAKNRITTPEINDLYPDDDTESMGE